MEITITNMKIKVYWPTDTRSWVLTTRLNGARYGIDKIESGLSVSFDCFYPCLTCDERDQKKCQSCNTVEGFAILYEEKCY